MVGSVLQSDPQGRPLCRGDDEQSPAGQTSAARVSLTEGTACTKALRGGQRIWGGQRGWSGVKKKTEEEETEQAAGCAGPVALGSFGFYSE